MSVDYISKSQLPSLLASLVDSPNGIYYKGNLQPSLFEKCIGIVGSRRNTRYTNEVLDLILPGLIQNGVTVISGFMYGVDADAHSRCLAESGKTVAVLPYGIDFDPPSEMALLYNSILENGLIISEYPGCHPPEKWTFIARNRIVAGLSHGVLVVEAAEKSGALITAQKAKQYSREVFAIPGSITNNVSKGTNNLIKNGAKLVSSYIDILDAFGWGSGLEAGTALSSNFYIGDEKEAKLHALIKSNLGCSYEDLLSFSEQLNFSDFKLITILTKLQISGLVVEEGGRFYVNKG